MAFTLDYYKKRLDQHSWSFSRFKDWDTCNLKAIANWMKIPSMAFQDSIHNIWGNYVHDQVDQAVKRGDFLLPPELAVWQPIMDVVKARVAEGWKVYPERAFCYALLDGIKHPYNEYTCEAYRCKMDLILESPCGTMILIIDWKTGKVANDDFAGEVGGIKVSSDKQLLWSLPAVVQDFPNAKTIKGMIAYIQYNDYKSVTYRAQDWSTALNEVNAMARAIRGAIQADRIRPMKRPNRLCSEFCPNGVCQNSYNAKQPVKFIGDYSKEELENV